MAAPLLNRGHRRTCLDDGSHGLVAEDRSRLDLRHVAFEDVQVGAADRDCIDLDHDVRRSLDLRVGHGLPPAFSGPVVNERFHQKPPFAGFP
jgi:hypothetical protein